jgi:antitoxin CcdA
MSYVAVSARIRRELYEKIQRYGIRVSEVIRKALEEEVGRRKGGDRNEARES